MKKATRATDLFQQTVFPAHDSPPCDTARHDEIAQQSLPADDDDFDFMLDNLEANMAAMDAAQE